LRLQKRDEAVKFLAESDLEKDMKKINKSTGIMLATAMLFFGFAALSLPLLEDSLKRQLCAKMDTFVSTWIEVAGTFAFSQGPINIAELAFLQKNDQILEAEVGSASQMPDVVFGSDSEMALADAHNNHQIRTYGDLSCSPKPAFVVPKTVAHVRVKCKSILPISTIAIAAMLKQQSLASEETFAGFATAFSDEKVHYIFRRAEELRVARAFENVRVLLERREAAMRAQQPVRGSLRTVVLTEPKRRLCPSENSDITTTTTGPETSF
jgi:hypothetical protein